MKTRKAIRFLSLALSAALILSCFAGCASSLENVESEKSEESADSAAETLETLSASESDSQTRTHGSEQGKEETVYVIASADGTPTKTIVSAWLKNPEEKETLSDTANLREIENVKGDETYTENSDGTLTWQADGSDLYYQGVSDDELPFAVSIRYTLDGEAVSAEELDGASGHLVMTFTYTNNTAAQRTVDGQSVTLYQPFVMLSGTVLDNETAANITVTNGKAVNTGEQTLVAGIALPGLTESLGLEELTDSDGNALDVTLPESVTIEADVTNFSLLTTVTVADNSWLGELSLDDADFLEELQDSLEELEDASAQLAEGSSELYDGAKELDTGIGTLSDGAVSLRDGAGELAEGMTSLVSGSAQLVSGAQSIAAGLKSGSSENPGVYEAAVSLQSGANSIASAAPQIASAAELVAQGLSALPDAVASASEGLSTAGTANSAALTALGTLLESENLTAEQQALLQQAMAYIQGSSTAISAVAEGLGSVGSSLSDANTALSAIESGANQIASGAQQLASGAGSVAEGAQTLYDGATQLASGAQQLESGASSAADGANTLYDGTVSLAEGVDTLRGGSAELLSGAEELRDGMAEFDSDGIQKLTALFEDDASGLLDRLRALQDYAEEYTSFSGAAEEGANSVRFILRTDSIGE